MKLRVIPCALLAALLLSSCISSRQRTSKKVNQEIEKMIEFAKKQINTPYVYGGSTPKGFDCSGYVQFVFSKFNYKLPRTATDQSKIGLRIHRIEQIKPGDLVFFTGQNAKSRLPQHVGIVVKSNKQGQFSFIHASISKGVTISYSSEDYYKKRYLWAQKIIY